MTNQIIWSAGGDYHRPSIHQEECSKVSMTENHRGLLPGAVRSAVPRSKVLLGLIIAQLSRTLILPVPPSRVPSQALGGF